jgi:hypothetical protein
MEKTKKEASWQMAQIYIYLGSTKIIQYITDIKH